VKESKTLLALAHVLVIHALDVLSVQLRDHASQLVCAYYPEGYELQTLLSTQADPSTLQDGCHALQLLLSNVVTLAP
jgi:hypothetical protein